MVTYCDDGVVRVVEEREEKACACGLEEPHLLEGPHLSWGSCLLAEPRPSRDSYPLAGPQILGDFYPLEDPRPSLDFYPLAGPRT